MNGYGTMFGKVKQVYDKTLNTVTGNSSFTFQIQEL